jgi:hypothetical protein
MRGRCMSAARLPPRIRVTASTQQTKSPFLQHFRTRERRDSNRVMVDRFVEQGDHSYSDRSTLPPQIQLVSRQGHSASRSTACSAVPSHARRVASPAAIAISATACLCPNGVSLQSSSRSCLAHRRGHTASGPQTAAAPPITARSQLLCSSRGSASALPLRPAEPGPTESVPWTAAGRPGQSRVAAEAARSFCGRLLYRGAPQRGSASSLAGPFP